MNSEAPIQPATTQPNRKIVTRVFGVGTAGMKVLEQLIAGEPLDLKYTAITTDAGALECCGAAEKILLESKPVRGLGTGGDPEQGRALAEENFDQLKAVCEGNELILLLAGMGGGAGTGISPVLARAAKETGALVLAFVILPFEFEGSRRQAIAEDGLDTLKAVVDGVICLPNQRILNLIDENTSVIETFKAANEFLAEGVRGFWRLIAHSGLIEIHLEDVRSLLHDRHSECAVAFAEAMGATRSREVTDKLLSHPMLDGGKLLVNSDAVLISLLGGPDLTMAEVQRVTQDIGKHCEQAQVVMGAAVHESFRERLAVTLIVSRKKVEIENTAPRNGCRGESLDVQLINPAASPKRSGSRFVPPPPTLSTGEMQQMLARQRKDPSRSRRASSKMRQGQLPLEIVSKGRFDKSEPTIHKGEDLDVPTYIRRGVALN